MLSDLGAISPHPPNSRERQVPGCEDDCSTDEAMWPHGGHTGAELTWPSNLCPQPPSESRHAA